MINLTNAPIWIGPKEDATFSKSIASAITLTNIARSQGYKYRASLKKLFPSPGKCHFDSQFIDVAYAISQLKLTPKNTDEIFLKLRSYGDIDAQISAVVISDIRAALKSLFVHLWQAGKVLLPINFVIGHTSFSDEADNELFTFIQSFEPKDGSLTQDERIYYYVPRLLMATSWKSAKDFSLSDWANAHQLCLLHDAGELPFNFPMAKLPWNIFPKVLFERFGGGVRFGEEDLKNYSRWITSGKAKSINFDAFIGAGLHQLSKQTAPANKALKKERYRKTYASKVNESLSGLASSAEHQDCIEYFKTYSTTKDMDGSWVNISGRYPGREAFELTEIAAVWGNLIERYFKSRTRGRGLEEVKSVSSSLRFLQSYLFGYLPWWQDIFGIETFKTPRSPKQFLRGLFVGQSALGQNDTKPLSLLEFIELKRKKASTYNASIRHINDFFSFIESDYADNEEIAGLNFRNPISVRADAMPESRPSKTTKIPFRSELYPILLLFVYELEAFGMALAKASFDNPQSFNEDNFARCKSYQFNKSHLEMYQPKIHFAESTYTVQEFPNVFRWFRGNVTINGERKENILIPNLTNLRALILGIESGLRFASIRHLDKRTWDKDNYALSKDSSPTTTPQEGEYVARFYVNTDKSKKGPWSTFIMYRARRMLLREQEFWSSLDGIAPDCEVPYQDREFSKFAPLVPLFRRILSCQTISESHIDASWRELLTSFHRFVRGPMGLEDEMIKIVPRGNDPEAVEYSLNLDFPNEKGNPFCPVSVLAVHTPHACRATWATLRMNTLDISIIANNLGHDSQRTTLHYMSPLPQDMMKMLERADKALVSDVTRFNREAIIRADSKNSALYKSLSDDKEATIKNFGLVSLMNDWSLEDIGNQIDGIEALKSGPMAKIKFFDTHICPVGEVCPKEVIEATGGTKRCGTCQLAVVSVDHLPAITAKLNQIAENIRYLTSEKERLIARQEDDLVKKAWESTQLEAAQYIGWSKLQSILLDELKKIKDNLEPQEPSMYSHSPEIVKRQLTVIAAKESGAEMVLTRLIESDAYPSMTTPHVKAMAKKIERQILAGIDIEKLFQHGSADEVEVAVRGLQFMMKTKKISATQILAQLGSGQKLLGSNDE